MNEVKRFTVTEQHLRLLPHMWVDWEDCEFGAPAIDCKRPYGNSDVLSDMREILADDSLTEGDLVQLHYETKHVIQIGLQVGFFEAGTYEGKRYSNEWHPVDS